MDSYIESKLKAALNSTASYVNGLFVQVQELCATLNLNTEREYTLAFCEKDHESALSYTLKYRDGNWFAAQFIGCGWYNYLPCKDETHCLIGMDAGTFINLFSARFIKISREYNVIAECEIKL